MLQESASRGKTARHVKTGAYQCSAVVPSEHESGWLPEQGLMEGRLVVNKPGNKQPAEAGCVVIATPKTI